MNEENSRFAQGEVFLNASRFLTPISCWTYGRGNKARRQLAFQMKIAGIIDWKARVLCIKIT